MLAKKIILTLICISITGVLQAGELGKRYLKLGNTYRETGKFSKAEDYLKQGRKMVNNDPYWSAAGDEYLGYLYRDMAKSDNFSSNSEYFLTLAKEYFEKSLSGYTKSVRQPDGSPAALQGLQYNIDEINGIIGNGSGASSGNNRSTGNGKIVNLDNSKLKVIPDNLPANIENFSAAYNRIKDFPSFFSHYSQLYYLNLKNNRIATLGSELGNAANLRILNLSGNRIKSVPANISSLKRLEVLDLSNNKLKSLPAGISELVNLKVLDISGNNIPFPQISTLIKNMPGANIVFDRYIREEEENAAE